MGSQSSEASLKEQKALSRLKRRYTGSIIKLLFVGVVGFIALGLALSTIKEEEGAEGYHLKADWYSEYNETQRGFQDWLEQHGTVVEYKVFNTLSGTILDTALLLIPKNTNRNRLSFFGKIYLGTHFAALRVTFVLLASLRIWIVLAMAGAIWGIWGIKLHLGKDVLGMTGNGRLFYSGIRADLKKVAASGAPDIHITGLACPQMTSEKVTSESELVDFLRKHGALNQTNFALASIILNSASMPAHVAPFGEEALFEKSFSGVTIVDNALTILKHAFSLQAEYIKGVAPTISELKELESVQRIDHAQYAALLKAGLNRVLTAEAKKLLATIDPVVLATVILAFESGKTMAFQNEGGRWLRKSTFIELCARSVLHSLPSYGDEYDFDRRTLIRRTLVYSSRSSVFGPVRFALDLSAECRALRQWTELLLAVPHSLRSVIDDVELYGVMCKVEAAWSQRLFAELASSPPEILQDAFAVSQSGAFYFGIKPIIKELRASVEGRDLRRIEELAARVSQKQRIFEMSADLQNDKDERQAIPAYQRIMAPLGLKEIESLAVEHGVTAVDMKDWLALRIALNSFGWLGRRVGDYTISDPSVIHLVFKTEKALPGTNELGLLGRSAMVSLRGSKLETRWGKNWSSRFNIALRTNMARNKEEMAQLLRGIEPKERDEEENTGVVVGA